ncbi:MAG TPA: hypothetical protein P5328_01900 [Candidatus Paceibacterota bacterium]|nr:hypothetical protein [Candidatus Paceibacterota bacterium]HRZ34493.1 hypothetical protein [Candidatus Paceibacterota bacterium]
MNKGTKLAIALFVGAVFGEAVGYYLLVSTLGLSMIWILPTTLIGMLAGSCAVLGVEPLVLIICTIGLWLTSLEPGQKIRAWKQGLISSWRAFRDDHPWWRTLRTICLILYWASWIWAYFKAAMFMWHGSHSLFLALTVPVGVGAFLFVSSILLVERYGLEEVLFQKMLVRRSPKRLFRRDKVVDFVIEEITFLLAANPFSVVTIDIFLGGFFVVKTTAVWLINLFWNILETVNSSNLVVIATGGAIGLIVSQVCGYPPLISCVVGGVGGLLVKLAINAILFVFVFIVLMIMSWLLGSDIIWEATSCDSD